MTVIPGLVRRAAAEAERHLREGAGLLVRAGRDLERSARLARLLPDYIERVAVLEREVRDQGTEVRAIRIELDSSSASSTTGCCRASTSGWTTPSATWRPSRPA